MNRLNLYEDEPEQKSILPKLLKSLTTAFRHQGLLAVMCGEEIRIDIGHKAAWIDKTGALTGEANAPSDPE